MQQCQHICRSCLLQFGQPWREPLRRQSLRRFLPQLAGRTITSSQAPGPRQADLVPVMNHHDVVEPGAKPRRSPLLHSSVRPVPEERHIATDSSSSLDGRHYPTADKEFWDRFEEIWNDDLDDNSRGTLAQHTKSSKGKKIGTSSKISSRTSHVIAKPKTATQRQTPRRRQKAANLKTTTKHKTAAKPVRRRYPADEWLLWARHESDGPSPRLKLLLQLDNVESMKLAWAKLPEEEKRAVGASRHLLASVILFAPERAHEVLEAIFQEPLPPPPVVAGTLICLSRRLRLMGADEQQDYAEVLADLITFLLDNSPLGYVRLAQNCLYSVLSALRVERVEELYHRLVGYQHPLHYNTRFQFASKLAKSPETKEMSLRVLRDALDTLNSPDINTPVGASVCTSILALKEEDARDARVMATPAALFKTLLDYGMRPNLITYSAIIRDLCLKMDLSTAWEVFHIMREQNIKPDATLYSILLNGSKLCGSDEYMEKAALEAYAANIRDPGIWNDLLHAIFLSSLEEARHREMKPPRTVPVFSAMLNMYLRFFDPGPLQAIMRGELKEFEGAATPSWSFTTRLEDCWRYLHPYPADKLLQPTSSTLGIMILGLVRNFSQPYDIIAFYSHYRELLKQGHPYAKLLIREQGGLIHDIVIKALLEHKGMLRVALDIVGEMLKNSPVGPDSPGPSPTPPSGEPPATNATVVNRVRHPPPSVYTWSILLHGFMHYGLHREAERILKLMQKHGVKPNIVTWNTLVAGYARLQNCQKMVSAMRRLESAGFQSDDWTLEAFSYVANKAKVIGLMEAAVERNRKILEKQDRGDEEARKLAEAHEAEIGVNGSSSDQLSTEDGIVVSNSKQPSHAALVQGYCHRATTPKNWERTSPLDPSEESPSLLFRTTWTDKPPKRSRMRPS